MALPCVWDAVYIRSSRIGPTTNEVKIMGTVDGILVLIGLALLIPILLIVFVVSFYAAAYTTALLHILFVEPIIFDTYSLFTIPYNDVASIAIQYWWYWVLGVLYFVAMLSKAGKKKCPYL